MSTRLSSILASGIVLSTFVTLMTPTLAHADGFSFSMPVDLERIHSDITAGRVECQVSSAVEYTPSPALEVGHGYSTGFSVVGGAYHGIVVVDVAINDGHTNADAHSYACNVELKANGEWFDLVMNHPVYPMNSSLPHNTLAKRTIE